MKTVGLSMVRYGNIDLSTAVLVRLTGQVNQLHPVLQQAGVPPLQIVGFIAGFLRADAATQATVVSLAQAVGDDGGRGGGAMQELVGAYASVPARLMAWHVAVGTFCVEQSMDPRSKPIRKQEAAGASLTSFLTSGLNAASTLNYKGWRCVPSNPHDFGQIISKSREHVQNAWDHPSSSRHHTQ